MRVAVYDQEDKVFPMAYTSTKGTLERGVGADLWRNTLSRIPTLFGRLVYLSNLRSPNTGRYEHHGLALVFGVCGESESDRELRKLHKQFFQEWLNLKLVDQVSEIRTYLDSLETGPKVTLETWFAISPYRNLVPASSKSMERDLYLSDMEAALEVLRRESGAALPDRES